MPFEKGHKKATGRPKGVPNKATTELRETLNKIIEAESKHIGTELAKLRKDDPQKYLTLLEKFVAYVVPKKRDITSDDKPIQGINISEHRTEPEADGGD
jgi:hypothetical protein